MFFGPSIYNLLSEHEVPNGTHISPTGHILSLSMGGKDGLGPTRTVEMRGACLAYGIAPENCIVLDQAWVVLTPRHASFGVDDRFFLQTPAG